MSSIVGLTYLLGVVDAERRVEPPLLLAAAGPVAAVYAELPPDELPGPTADPLDESGPLARLARWHDQMLRLLAADGPVLPIRLGGVAASPAAVAHTLSAHAAELAAELNRVRGRDEWMVRTVALPRTQPDRNETSGTSYLLARRAETQERATAATLLDSTYRMLAGCADRQAAGSFLVAADQEPAFLATAAERDALLHEHGYRLHVTGPLPPYSFTDIRLTFDDHG